MARPKLRHPGQSLPTQVLMGMYEFAASLKLAVFLIFSAAAVLAIATFVEKWYGLRGVHFGIYGTWWFTLLNALLAMNIFCAATIRYPWKRHQTGFVITHIGLLTLLFGCLLSRRGGIDAQMPVMEDKANSIAFEDTAPIRMSVVSHGGSQPSGESGTGEVTRVIPFEGGPFNWSDYKDLPLFYRLAHRDQGVVYDDEGIKIEILDYYADSEEVDVPRLKLQLSSPQMPQMGAEGRETKGPERWNLVELQVQPSSGAMAAVRPFGRADRQEVGGGAILFWLAGTEAEQRAFLESRPVGPLGSRGQVVLFAGGKKFRLNVEEQLGKRVPLGETGLEAEITHFYKAAILKNNTSPERLELDEYSGEGNARQPAVELLIHSREEAAGGQPRRMVLLADLPDLSVQDHQDQVFGSFWVPDEKTSEQLVRGQGTSRIDIIQGADEKLYYRYWNRKEIVTIAELPTNGKRVDAFKMPIAQLQMYVESFVSSLKPEKRFLPLKFDKDQLAVGATRAAKMRVTVDGNTEEFWLKGAPARLIEARPDASEQRMVLGNGRMVALSIPLDYVDVGFLVELQDFERKLDPGTSQPSHYSSWVRFLDRETRLPLSGRPIEQDQVLITMNAPVDFSDPKRGRSYRLFQEAFRGPFVSGDGIYESHYRSLPADSKSKLRDQLFMSILTVNYDPGRGVKYIGCLLIVAGITTMFYMRAYFFKPKTREAARSELVEAVLVH